MSAHRYTMAQMKNKTNETKNVHTVYSMICGHDKSAPYSGCTWVNVNNPQHTFRRRRGPIHRARPQTYTG